MIVRTSIFGGLLRAALAALVCAAWGIGRAEPSDDRAAAKQSPLEYVKVFVPADRIEQWPREGVRYAPPLEQKEFDRLVEILKSRTGVPAAASARVAQAEYTARLTGEQLVDGRATLDVEHPAEGSAVASLEGCGLAIRNPVWDEPEPRPATIGLGADGKLVALVDRSSKLTFDWSLRGVRDVFGGLTFPLRLCSCPASRLTVDLPASTVPVVDRGMVEGPWEVPAPAGGADPVAGDAGPFRRWRIRFGGHARATLRILPEGTSGDRRPLVLLRQSTTYRFSERGLEVSAELTLDVHHRPLRQLAVRLDPELHLAAARYGDRPVEWTVVSDPDGPTSRVTLEFSEPIQGTGCLLQLRALAPLRPGVRWPLPGLRVPEAFWQEGAATLLVPGPLSLNRLAIDAKREKGKQIPGGRPSKVTPLGGPQGGESIQVQLYGPDAVVEVVIARRPNRVEMAGGTTIRWGADSLTGRMVADFHSLSGERFVLEAAVPQTWNIDSVTAERLDSGEHGSGKDDSGGHASGDDNSGGRDSAEDDPGELLEDWGVEAPGSKNQLLRVRLGQSLRRNRGIRLVIGARRRRTVARGELGADQLQPAHFRDVVATRRLLSVQPEAPYRLKLSGDLDVSRLDPKDLVPGDAALVEAGAGAVVLAIDSGAENLRLGLSSEGVRFEAEIDVSATVGQNTLTESYRIRCQPKSESPRIERLLVHLSQSRDEPPAWSVAGEEGAALSVRQLSDEEQLDAGIGAGGQTWEITLRRPRFRPFEIRARRTSPLTEQEQRPVSLASLPEATSQRGTLAIHAAGSAPLEVKTRRLQSIPAELPGPRRYLTVRAAFRYEPSRDALAAVEPAVTVRRATAKDGPAAAWVWSRHVESLPAPDGAAHHRTTFRLENTGRETVRLKMPPQASLRGVWVDGVEMERLSRGSAGGKSTSSGSFSVPLPANVRFPTLTVDYTTEGHPLHVVASVGVETPKIDIPVLSRQWTVWLPPGYAPLAKDRCGRLAKPAIVGWSRRLMGPLRSEPPRKPFNLFSGEEWRSAVVGAAPNAASADAAPLLKALGSGKATWRQLLRRYNDEDSRDAASRRRLLIDQRAVAAEGILPDSPAAAGSGKTEIEQGLSLLERSHLALVVAEDAVLVTSANSLNLFADQLRPSANDRIAQVTAGPLREEISASLSEPGRFMTAEAWVAPAHQAAEFWSTRPGSLHSSLPGDGWTAYRWEYSGHGPSPLRIYHKPTVQALGWAAFLLSAALGWWLLVDRPDYLVMAAGISAVVAVLVPAPAAPIATGVFLGMLFCGAARLVRRRQGSPPPRPDRPPNRSLGSSRSIAVLPTKTILLLIGTIAATTVASAAGPAASEDEIPQGPRTLYRILVPVDAQKKPTGKLYLPEEFYLKLARRAKAAAAAPQGWLIRKAVYHGTLERSSASGLDMTELRASYQIEVFQLSSRVRIPLSRKDVNLIEGGAVLDDHTTELDWEPGGEAVLVHIDEPGAHRLQLAMRPASGGEGGLTGFDLAIPPVAGSQLDLDVPVGFQNIQLPSAVGAISRDAETGRLHAELGPADRLSVRWPQQAESAAAADVEVRQLCWLKVRPGSVVLDAKFRFKIKGRLARASIRADSRLRLLPLDAGQGVSRYEQTQSDDVQTIQFERNDPAADPWTLSLSFLLTGTSDVGNLRLPSLEAQADRTVGRWLAVSVDSTLAYEATAGSELEKLAPEEFAKAWGSEAAKADMAYRLPRGDVPWSIATQPRSARMTVDQVLTVSAGRKTADLSFEALLTTSEGYRFQYQLATPRELQIESVFVLDAKDRTRRLSRWSRDEKSGEVTVFLDVPANGESRLLLRGAIPIRSRGKLSLPHLRFHDALVQRDRFRIFRRADTLVEVVKPTGLEPVADAEIGGSTPGLGRLVVLLAATQDSGKVGASLQLAPNLPSVRAAQITSLRADGDAFAVEVDYYLTVAKGLVDTLRFDIPASLGRSLKLDPAIPFQLVDIPGQTRRRLVATPQKAVGEKYHLRISVPAALSPRDPVPEIVPRHRAPLERLERFIDVPTEFESQPIVWETRFLNPAPLPDEFTDREATPGPRATYQVVGPRFRATLKSQRRISGVPWVRVADLRIVGRSDGTCFGVATFDMEPAGLPRCTLELPERYRLVHATVAGLPAIARAVDPSQRVWELSLGSGQFPLRIEVVFTGRLPASGSGGVVTLPAPKLRDLHVEQTLWTVYGSSPAGKGESKPAAGAVGALRQEFLRLKAATGLADLPNYVRAESEQREIDRWYARWARRWRISRNRVAVERLQSGGAGFGRTELSSVEDEQARIADQLGTTWILDQLANNAVPSEGASEAIRASATAGRRPVRRVFQGAKDRLALRKPAASSPDLGSRLLAALALAALTWALFLLVRRGFLKESALRWSGAVGVLAGLAWWLWLTPSLLGVAIVLLSLAGSFWLGGPSNGAGSNSALLKNAGGVRAR